MSFKSLIGLPHFNQDLFECLEKDYSFTINKNGSSNSFEKIYFLDLQNRQLFNPPLHNENFKDQLLNLAINGRSINLKKFKIHSHVEIYVESSNADWSEDDEDSEDLTHFELIAVEQKKLVLDINDEITYVEKNNEFEFFISRKESLISKIEWNLPKRIESHELWAARCWKQRLEKTNNYDLIYKIDESIKQYLIERNLSQLLDSLNKIRNQL